MIRSTEYFCPMEVTLKAIGGKWKLIILWWIAHDVNRFSELLILVPGISKGVLAQTLNELHRDQILSKEKVDGQPRQIRYKITKRGSELLPITDAMCEWGLASGLCEKFGYEDALKSLGYDVEEFKRSRVSKEP